MAKTVKSARGASVNFDLLQIQNQLASVPKPVNVAVREDLIDRKLRRRTKKATLTPDLPVEESTVAESTPTVDQSNTEDSK